MSATVSRARQRRLACALALLGLVAGGLSAARAGEPDEPIGDGKYGRVRLGWEGHVLPYGLTPVTVFLENPDPGAHSFRVVVGTEAAPHEETVELQSGGRRKLTFFVNAGWRTSVSIAEDGRLVANGQHSGASFPLPAVLLVDGDPGSRAISEIVSGVAVLTCAPEDVPPELACIACFQLIVVRHANPTRAGEGVRGVLEDYARAGGTVVVCPEPNNRETRALWEETDASPVSSPTSFFQEKRRGLGRVLLAPADPGSPSLEGLATRTALASEIDFVPRRLFPRVFSGETENEAAHRAGTLLVIFFGAYFLVAGPILGRRLRGATPARVLGTLALLFVASCGAAFGMAAALRHRTSRVDAFTYIVIPEAGEAVAATEVIVSSGGAARETITLEGEDVSATAAPRSAPSDPYDYRISNAPLWSPASSTTVRAIGRHPVTFENLAIPALGDGRVNALSRAKGYRALDTRIEHDPKTGSYVAQIRNTSAHALGTIVIYELGQRLGQALHARLTGGLEVGASATAPLTTRSFHGTPLHLAGLPTAVNPIGWETLPPRQRDGSDPRFVLIAEDEPPVLVKVHGVPARERAWRVEGIPMSRAGTTCFVGLTVKPFSPGVRVVTSSVATSERPVRGWLPTAGTTILAVGGMPVRSQEDLDRAFGLVPPGASVEITLSNTRTSIELDAPAPPGRSSAPIPGDEGE